MLGLIMCLEAIGVGALFTVAGALGLAFGVWLGEQQ